MDLEVFRKNIPVLDREEQAALSGKRAVVAGLSAEGALAAELCLRTGFGTVVLVDRECFTEEDLAQSLAALPRKAGKARVYEVEERLHAVFPEAQIKIWKARITLQTVSGMIAGADAVLCGSLPEAEQQVLSEACEGVPAPLLFIKDEMPENAAEIFAGNGLDVSGLCAVFAVQKAVRRCLSGDQ